MFAIFDTDLLILIMQYNCTILVTAGFLTLRIGNGGLKSSQ